MEKNTTEEQIRVPLHVDRWLNAMRDQLNTDTDVRTDGTFHSLRVTHASAVVLCRNRKYQSAHAALELACSDCGQEWR